MKFDYSEYIRLLNCLTDNGYVFKGYTDTDFDDRTVILRHDVDVSIESAARVAEIEKSMEGIKSTYFILMTSDFYNPFSRENMFHLESIMSNGHEIGLHFDEQRYFSDGDWTDSDIIEKITLEKAILEKALGVKINAVSMHRPSARTLDANLVIPGMVNSYSSVFFNEFKYVSDSYHRWRENVWEVIERGFPKIQLLTHPFWYHDEDYTRSETFHEFIENGKKTNYKLIEDNLLPPGITLKESFEEDEQ